MATTEEMNVTIALYMGAEIMKGHQLIRDKYFDAIAWEVEDCHEYGRTTNYYSKSGLEYQYSWDWLLPVWDNLRMDITGPILDMGFKIGQAIKDCHITEAHRLIYEAITWLNQNK